MQPGPKSNLMDLATRPVPDSKPDSKPDFVDFFKTRNQTDFVDSDSWLVPLAPDSSLVTMVSGTRGALMIADVRLIPTNPESMFVPVPSPL